MPTENKKSKSKSSVEIKVEAQDLHPLEHYIDDRVELIRQIFMSLKSKTIKSIAPDFLQGKSLESIQEYCLDELLGISKKRLQSIINATQCPDNTDSSDSEVENIEEHISLEEISSDSADDALHTKKSKGKAKGRDKKNGADGGTGSGKKEISVLELLELQARARAIRSQLALEPVTKIELDSDHDSDGSSSSKAVKNSLPTTATTAENSKDQTNSSKPAPKTVVQEANGMQIIRPTVPAVKPVRLKRNFRQRQNDDYDPDDEDETKSIESSEVKESDKKSSDDKVEKSADNVKEDEKKSDELERSPSPDLIPIIHEPETYCISSDSDEPGSSSVPKYITYPTVVREKLPETEDELFLKKIKEGSGADLRDLIKARRGEKQTENGAPNNTDGSVQNKEEESNKNSENSNEKSPENEPERQEDCKDTEPEEGELTDGDDQDEIDMNQVTILSSDDENDTKSKKSDSAAVTQEDTQVSETKKDETSSESSSSEDGDSESDSSDAPMFKEPDDDDDDIIDLGKYEELDFEVERTELKIKKSKKTKKKLKTINVSNEAPAESPPEAEGVADDQVDRKSVDNEEINETIEVTESTSDKDTSKAEKPATHAASAENDTWQTRWLRGRNVTKVMATSRLANKVRTKIKQKKSKTEQETLNTDSSDVPATATEPATIDPSVEEGSIQHYEVLVAQENEKHESVTNKKMNKT